jgi:hypothetical protein
MNGGVVWEQKARDGADLILGEGHARLGGYDDGADELRQKIKVGKNTGLVYEVKIETAESETAESGRRSDWMRVWITNEKGEKLAVLGDTLPQRLTGGSARLSGFRGSQAGRFTLASGFAPTRASSRPSTWTTCASGGTEGLDLRNESLPSRPV